MAYSDPPTYPSPAMSDWTSSTSSPQMFNEKTTYNNVVYTSLEPAPQQVTHNSIHNPFSPLGSPHDQLALFKKYQRHATIFGYIHNILSLAVTIYMDAIMVYVLFKYYKTKDIPAPNRSSPWASGTTLWPTLVLLAASSITLLLDLGGLIALCCSSNRKRGEKLEGRFGNISHVVFVVKWIAVLILYRIGKTSKDLWGWSCDERAANIQQFYKSELDFKSLCLNQTVSWGLTFVEVFLKFVLLVVIFVVGRKVKHLNSKH